MGWEAEGKVCVKGREAYISNDWIKKYVEGSVNMRVFGNFLTWRWTDIITRLTALFL